MSDELTPLLHRINYIEKVGTGIMRIRQSVAEHGGTELELRYNDFFTATFRFKLQETVPEYARGELGAQSTTQSWAESGAESLSSGVLHCLEKSAQSKSEIAQRLRLKSVTGALNRAVKELLEQKRIERTIPDKPNSRLQKYRLTPKGRDFLNREAGDE